MARINEIDRRVLAGLDGPDRLKALLAERGYTVKSFAQKHRKGESQVSRCINNQRRGEEIRDLLAKELGRKRAEIDGLIES